MKVNYQNTIIYKLCCRDVNVKEIYVGHTTNFKLRNNDHKSNCNNPNSKKYNLYKYKFIRDNGGYDNWVMIKIKDYPCNNKREAEAEENKNMIELGATLNSNKSYTTKQERKKQQKDYNEMYGKKHYQVNKDKINEKHRKYYHQNKDIINEKKKKYREENRHIINEKAKKKVICDKCGCTITKRILKQHQQTDKCKRLSVCMILDD